MAEEAPGKAKKKTEVSAISSARKRALQSEKQRLRNRSHRAAVLTAVRDFEGALSKKEANDQIKEKLAKVYRLMDKGVKKGIFTVNKAARTKSRLCSRIASS